MSSDKATNPCNKFQANFFSKSKCQNCFKSRELHLLNEHNMEQAKPIYGGWLCLAPEGTDFDNPMQRSRKWQRRFFILYEHGSLTFALDELPSTLPQGTVNMNLCTEVVDAEPRTGQRNGLCIVTPEQEIFIRGDSKEIIHGWCEQLAVFPRTNKQNQKKKRKVEPVATQEPSPAKMAATDPCFTSMDDVAESGSSLWQEVQQGREPDVTPIWTVTHTDPPGPERSPAGSAPSYLCPFSGDPLALDDSGAFSSSVSSLDLAELGGGDDDDENNTPASANNQNQREDASHHSAAERLLGLEPTSSNVTGKEPEEETTVSRTGRSEARTSKREKLQSCGDIAQLTAPPPQRRSKSLDRRTSETAMIPDLLNFKKGWMVKLDEENQWKKYWFVLSTDSLRYYKDSIAEEASDLDGEIDLTKCFHVSEYQVQRNYGFQIHTKMDVYTLSAMTAGIRRNWIQALMKNVHPANAPDVASLPGHHVPCGPPEALPKPDVTQDSSSAEAPAERDQSSKPKSVMEKRREGRYKTFDWTEFRPATKTTPDPDRQGTKAPTSLDLGDTERRKRREERRRRYESMLGISLAWEVMGDDPADGGGAGALSPRSQRKVEEEIEQCWKQVETTVFRLEKTVPLYTEAKDTVEMEELLDSYRKAVEDLEAQLAESDRRRRELEAQLSTAGYQQQVCPTLGPPLSSEVDFCPLGTNETPFNSHTPSLNSLDRENIEMLQQQTTDHRRGTQEELGLIPQHAPESQTPSIWLHDTEGNLQELGNLLFECPATINTPSLPPVLDSQHLLSESEGETREGRTTNLQNQLPDQERVSSPETQINGNKYSPGSLIMDKADEGDDESPSCCVEERLPSDQAVVLKLSEEVELLTTQNEALNQRNQEMLNQLTEADREIESLKAELNTRYDETNHLPEVEQLSQTRVEDLERDLSVSNQQLLEAQAVITSLEKNLRDTEALLQLRESTLQALGVPAETEEAGQETKDTCRCDKKAEGYLLRCFEATEAKLTELERHLVQSQATCRELQAQNAELREAERRHSRRAAEAEEDMRRLNQELEKERLKDGEKVARCNGCVSGEEKIQQVVEGMVMRQKATGKLLEVIERLGLGAIRTETECEREEVKPTAVSQLEWEEEFWSSLLNEMEANPSPLSVNEPTESLLKEVTEHMMVEKRMMLLGHGLCDSGGAGVEGIRQSNPSEELVIVGNNAGVMASETKEEQEEDEMVFDFNNQLGDVDRTLIGYFTDITQVKISLLNRFASSGRDKLQLVADKLCDFYVLERPQACFVLAAATEALYCCRISRIHSKHQRELEETKQRLLASSLICRNCVDLMLENEELRNAVAALNQAEDADVYDTDTERQVADTRVTDEMETEKVNGKCPAEVEDESADVCENESSRGSMEIPAASVVEQRDVQAISDGNAETSDASNMETDGDLQTEDVALLRRRVEELEEQLCVAADEMNEEFVGKLTSVQMQYGKEIEKLKATCERGFAAMEDSHQKVVEELQRRHQQEVERLLVDRDRLLEEESAATATAIEAIKNAHRLELEREVQRRSQSENGTGNSDLAAIYRQHGEELASCQQELQVLSQQFSLKCLENVHLAQALDAERKALCQCQQENQDLRTRNQELSGHLAAEITRLCSLAKQDVPPLSQDMDVYELEITLRVKESEVQCLKQELTSLKDELQSAQRDARSATKKYKDMFTELSMVRAKTERDLDDLRENLRLAHQALGQIS